jgi:GH24 family phage-related lysozyme (muramidase)
MKISDEGLRLIRSFEGYHTRLPDGGCAAYLCPAGVPTIGHGVTEGIKLGMVWTAEEAETALRREIAKHEAAVTRLVTVDINQNEFDALVSFSYNCGIGALTRSGLLRKLNKGDRLGASKEFAKWNRGGGRVLKGLVSRREREAALFLKPTQEPNAPFMPQEVAETKEISKPAAAAGGVAAGGAVATVPPTIPSLPTPPDLSPVTAWQSFGETIHYFGQWLLTNPVIAVFCAAWVLFFAFLPKIMERSKWLRSLLSS